MTQPVPDFDELIDRFGTHCDKWDMMVRNFDVSAARGLPMWVADMDFRPPAAVQAELEAMVSHGVYGYFGDPDAYHAAIRWWMETRHGWKIAAEDILTTHGLVNGTALAIDALTRPGDGVAVMAPVYHAFARIIRMADRRLVELPLAVRAGRHEMDFDRWEAMLPEGTRMLILCSPHNPGGRVWTEAELRATADFCRRHDLWLVSDEIHHDLVMPGHRHRVLATLVPEVADRLITLTAATKTFNLAGMHTGNLIITDSGLRSRVQRRLWAMGISPNAFGARMATAAYSPGGAAWVDALVPYLDANRRLFEDGVREIPGVRPMALEATYLCWVDFTGTGMSSEEVIERIEREAQIAATHGVRFGLGGEGWMRFNIAMPRVRVAEAVERLRVAFADLQ